ncbi:MAG: ATP-binding protein [Acidimicrobiales bacterium]|nr:ATP-binding protein [Acidimicrobiales bacterium]
MNVRVSSRFRGERTAVPSARAFVRHALQSAAPSVDVAERIELAAAEACNNAILHARGSAFTVNVVIDDGQVVVTVADDGEGFEPPSSSTMPSPQTIGQRGLPLMRALVDEVDVTSDGDGTTVVLVQGLDSEGAGTPVGVDG